MMDSVGFVIVYRDSGRIVEPKIYTTAGRAQGAINRWHVSGKDMFTVIPMPSADILRKIAAGDDYEYAAAQRVYK